MNYTKSPLNYTGNKFKLLEQILPLFPNDINTFYDLFGGSGVVGLNTNCNKIIYNDSNAYVYELVKYLSECDAEYEISLIDKDIQEYGLCKKGKEQYIKFREVYNTAKIERRLFTLSCYSLNGCLRFNKSGDFNMSCGDKDFNQSIRERFVGFNNVCRGKNIAFSNNTYSYFKDFNNNDFVYLDPPYLQTTTTYNETSRHGGGWTQERENEMYTYLNGLTEKGIRWGMSNVSVYRGEENESVLKFMKNYNVHMLNFSYTNNNKYKKDNKAYTQEVLITNY